MEMLSPCPGFFFLGPWQRLEHAAVGRPTKMGAASVRGRGRAGAQARIWWLPGAAVLAGRENDKVARWAGLQSSAPRAGTERRWIPKWQ
jgi:hypothetical protein